MRRKKETDNKIIWKMDMKQLSLFLKYILSNHTKKSDIHILNELMKCLDMDAYKYNQDVYLRLELIRHLAEAISVHKLVDKDTIHTYIINQDNELEDLMNELDWEDNSLSSAEVRNIATSISSRLNASILYSTKSKMLELYDKLEESGFHQIDNVVSEMRSSLQRTLTDLQNTTISNGMIRHLDFADGVVFNNLMDTIVSKSKKPGAILQTGIRMMNSILGPGFRAKRFYVFLGLTGKFKSGTLLNIADQIRLYNPQINAVEDGMRKTILFITMENSIEETVERLFDMYSDVGEDFKNCTPEYVMTVLRERGKYNFDDESGISITILYFPNLSINTARLYNIMQECEDNNRKVICLILDYLKRIDSVRDNGGEERLRLGYASAELKSFAEYYEIPVITAMQVNREGNSIVDAAMRDNKADLLQFVGSSNIGSSWAIAEEADWMAIVSLERKKSTDQLFLSVKRLKSRIKTDVTVLDYFNHPFTNEKNIKLAEDVNQQFPVSIRSLATDLESVIDMNEEEAKESRRPQILNLKGAEKSSKILEHISLF